MHKGMKKSLFALASGTFGLGIVEYVMTGIICHTVFCNRFEKKTNQNFMRQLFRMPVAAMAAASLLIGCSEGNSTKETGELAWPEITRQAKPWSRWWWPASAASESDMTYMLDAYSDAGLGGLEVTTIYGVKGYEDKYRKYLSPEWMDLFTFTLKEAEKRDLGIDLANASGWPFGGNWVTPDYACRYLAHKTYALKGGESLNEKIEYVETPLLRTLGLKTDFAHLKYPIAENDSLQQYAFEQVRYPQPLPLIAVTANSADGRYEDLSGKVDTDGKLNWTAPEGDWTICAMFLGWHGKMVERAGPGGEGDVIDHFSKEAAERYLAKFDEAFKGYDVSTIRYYFNDSYEVDDSFGQSDWTEDFFEEFKDRRGYDLKPYMNMLLNPKDVSDTAERVVFDYRTTIGELLREEYSMTWQQWAAKQGKGIRNQAHGSPANIMDLYAVSDVPETEGRSIIGMKTASSAAHVTDKPLTSSESATWLNEHFLSTLGDVKDAIDIYFLSGVNHVFYHGTCMSPKDAPWPGWMFYAAVHFKPENSFWEDFPALNRYIAHCQTFLQAGRPDNDLLLFFNATDLLSQRGREPMLYHMNQNTPLMSAIGKSAQYLYDKGYSWDYISDRMVLENIHVRKGKILTAGGSAYKAIIVPECGKMLPETFRRLVELAKEGAVVIVENDLPADVPGLSNLEKGREELEGLEKNLAFTDENGVRISRTGKGQIMVSSDLDAMLALAGISREIMYDNGMQCIRRIKDDGGKYYFVKNASGNAFEGWLPIDAVCGTAGIYNPMDERFGYASIRKGDKGTEVFMKLLPGEALLLETFAGEYSGNGYDFYEEAGEAAKVDGPWEISFIKGGPELPAVLTAQEPGSWTAYGKEYEVFSGTAQYNTALKATEGEADCWSLNLGDVRSSASVYLDGEYLGTVLGAPYTVLLSADKAAKGGELTIKVSNLTGNRIADLDKRGVDWKIMYNANLQARLPMDRDEHGYFTAKNWPVQDSGLLGPVTITPLRRTVPSEN